LKWYCITSSGWPAIQGVLNGLAPFGSKSNARFGQDENQNFWWRQKTVWPRQQNLPSLPETVYLAQKMGKGLGKRDLLLWEMQENSSSMISKERGQAHYLQFNRIFFARHKK
jgi:hypothetical protein